MASNSNASQTFTCALTGLTPLTDAVVTPSGYICSRKLLLTKLSENGGMDPFDTSRTLDESTLVDLTSSDSAVAPPRPPTATSLPSLLTQISTEFDTVLLELYDTRKSLEETRRELSSALYQNDAAVRVVARLVRERDEARGALEEFLAKGGVAPPASAAAATDGGEGAKRSEKRAAPVEEDAPPSSKKPRSNNDAAVAEDLYKIPQDTLNTMTSTWEILSKNRRTNKNVSQRQLIPIPKNNAANLAMTGNDRRVTMAIASPHHMVENRIVSTAMQTAPVVITNRNVSKVLRSAQFPDIPTSTDDGTSPWSVYMAVMRPRPSVWSLSADDLAFILGLIDGGANVGLANPNYLRLLQYVLPSRKINVTGIGNSRLDEMRIGTFAGTAMTTCGTQVILIFHEYGEMNTGEDGGQIVHSKMQLEDGGCRVNDRPLRLTGDQNIVPKTDCCCEDNC